MSVTSSSDDTMDEEEVSRNFEAEAQLILKADILPKKSADRYVLVYETYGKWKSEHRNSLSTSEENNLVVYFKELRSRLAPSTLWSVYSMLKTTLTTNDNIDISQFHKLKSILKNNSKGYKPKKSCVFTWDEVMNFINDAPDYDYLALKVVLIFGICGAARCKEIKDLTVADVEDLGDKYIVSINDTKNGLPRQFLIGDAFYGRVKEYISLKPTDFPTEYFFIQYHKGKCVHQVIGRNSVGLIPKRIAQYLKLKNPDKYTGHCFRRTSATLLSNSGANTTMLKQLGGWKSAGIAEGYVENSLINRKENFNNITQMATSNAQLNIQPSTSYNSASNTIIIDKSKELTETTVAYDDLYEDFEIDDNILTAIEKSVGLKESKAPMPSFTTASNKRIIMNSDRQTAQATHFLNKSPISVYSRGPKNEPSLKKRKVDRTETNAYNQASESTRTDPVAIKNPCVKYDNCTFHGNIINNFYNSQITKKTEE